MVPQQLEELEEKEVDEGKLEKSSCCDLDICCCFGSPIREKGIRYYRDSKAFQNTMCSYASNYCAILEGLKSHFCNCCICNCLLCSCCFDGNPADLYKFKTANWFCGQLSDPFITQLKLRKYALYHGPGGDSEDWSKRYKCCQGYHNCCYFRAGYCCEKSCPCICLNLEVYCCLVFAINATRKQVMDDYHLLNGDADACANRIIRCQNFLSLFSCCCYAFSWPCPCCGCSTSAKWCKQCAGFTQCMVGTCRTAQIADEIQYHNPQKDATQELKDIYFDSNDKKESSLKTELGKVLGKTIANSILSDSSEHQDAIDFENNVYRYVPKAVSNSGISGQSVDGAENVTSLTIAASASSPGLTKDE